MIDCMIDFETWGTSANTAVVQIGACYFDRTTGQIGDTFSVNVDAESSIKSGASIDASTLYWWLGREKAAIDSITRAPLIDIKSAFTEFNDWLRPAKAIWCHATFDFPILSQTLKRLNIKPSFKYTIARDLRTITDITGGVKLPREGTHHNGLDDAKYQAKCLVEMLKKIK